MVGSGFGALGGSGGDGADPIGRVMKQTLGFSTTNDTSGFSSRTVSLDDDGTLVIEGHDLGSGVESFWGSGNSEYEFCRTVRPPAVATLQRLIGAKDAGLLPALRARFATTSALEAFLAEQGIKSEFWSRVGD